MATVFCFHRSTNDGGTEWHCLYPAIREAIERLGGSVLEETALEVDDDLLDASGRYFGPPNCNHFFHIAEASAAESCGPQPAETAQAE